MIERLDQLVEIENIKLERLAKEYAIDLKVKPVNRTDILEKLIVEEYEKGREENE